MDSDIAIQLAADILQDHFGNAAKVVGKVLFERGSLSLQNIIRFANQANEVGDEPLRFAHARNAVLSLVQHGIVTVKRNSPEGETRVLPQLYTINLDEVLSRLRFSHFLEFILWQEGEEAWHLVSVLLKYGRAPRKFMISEAQRVLKEGTVEEVEAALRRLLQAGLLYPVAPFMALASSEAASSSQAGSKESGDAQSQKAAGGKRKLDQVNDNANALVPLSEAAEDPVYTFSRSAFNLCLVKSQLCRLLEERTNQHASMVLSVLLSKVIMQPGASRVEVSYMPFMEVEAEMHAKGFLDARSDANSQRDRLRRVLDFLSGHEDGLLRKRMVRSNHAGKGGAAEEPAWGVEWAQAKKVLMSAVTTQLIRSQFGIEGLRIYNLLTENEATPQKLQEDTIFRTCMVPHEKGREVLHAMTTRHIIKWQEVAKQQQSSGASAQPLLGSFWLYYIDRKHVEMSLLHDVLKAILNLRIRFRTEVQKAVPLMGHPTKLTLEQKRKLEDGYAKQDILERGFLVLDTVVLVFRHFGN